MRRRTKIGALGTAGLVAIALFSPLSATADIEGTLTAGADADLVEASGVSIPPACGDEAAELFGLEAGIECTFQLATLRVGDTETGDSTAADLSNGLETGLVSFGHASNTDVEALTNEGVDGEIAAQLVTTADAYQLGGPTEDADQLGATPENPLLYADGMTVDASATDISDGNTQCPEGDEIRLSHGRNELVNLAIGPGQMPEGGDVVSAEGVSFAHSQVDLVDALVDGEGYGIRSSAATDLASVSLLDGNITLDAIQPRLVGTHDGENFSFEYTAPDVVLTAGGETITDGTILDQLDAELIDPLLTGLEPVTDELEPLLKVNLEIKDTDDVEVAGNSATVSDVVLLEIELLNALDEEAGGIEVLSLSVGDLSVSAEAPEGGVIIDCANPPLTVEKDGPTSAEPGETFTYTIDVTNETGCDATEVVVTDQITGPDGFEVVGTSPAADSVDGGTVRWDVGDMADGETATFTVDVTVPDSATVGDSFEDTATAAGNCDGRALPLGSDTLDGPAIQVAAARTDSLPRTGGGFALLGLAAAAAAGALRRR